LAEWLVAAVLTGRLLGLPTWLVHAWAGLAFDELASGTFTDGGACDEDAPPFDDLSAARPCAGVPLTDLPPDDLPPDDFPREASTAGGLSFSRTTVGCGPSRAR
jgi:hypothetical protein